VHALLVSPQCAQEVEDRVTVAAFVADPWRVFVTGRDVFVQVALRVEGPAADVTLERPESNSIEPYFSMYNCYNGPLLLQFSLSTSMCLF